MGIGVLVIALGLVLIFVGGHLLGTKEHRVLQAGDQKVKKRALFWDSKFSQKLHKNSQKLGRSLEVLKHLYREEKSIHHHPGSSSFSFSGSETSMVYTFLSGPMVYILSPCLSKEMVYAIASFCSVTSGSGDT